MRRVYRPDTAPRHATAGSGVVDRAFGALWPEFGPFEAAQLGVWRTPAGIWLAITIAKSPTPPTFLMFGPKAIRDVHGKWFRVEAW